MFGGLDRIFVCLDVQPGSGRMQSLGMASHMVHNEFKVNDTVKFITIGDMQRRQMRLKQEEEEEERDGLVNVGNCTAAQVRGIR